MNGTTMPGSDRATEKKPLHTLTTFRFFAALAIVFSHALQNIRYDYLASAVSFFFVLSGFVLTYVHPRIKGKAEFLRFWIARVARIWPLHLFTLVTVMVLQPFGRLPFKHFVFEYFVNVSLLQCWVPVRRVAMSFNFVSWSISVELFLYFAFPFLLPFIFKRPMKLVLIAVALYFLLAIGAAVLGLPDVDATDAISYQSFLFCPALHLYQFVLGMAVAVWWTASRHSAKGIVAWSCLEALVFGAILCFIPNLRAVSLALVQGHTEYAIDRQMAELLTTPVFALLIYVFASQAGILSRLFAQKWLVYLGDISFSTYMIHCIVLSPFEKIPAFFPPIVKWILFGLAVFAASGLLYALLEKPARKSLVGLADLFLRPARQPEGGLTPPAGQIEMYPPRSPGDHL